MAVRWNSEFFTAMEYRDLQANAMAVDNTGTFVLLAGYVWVLIGLCGANGGVTVVGILR